MNEEHSPFDSELFEALTDHRWEGERKDDVRQGVWTRYHENGEKSAQVPYVDGKRNGLWVAWHQNGQKQSDGKYNNGVPDGLWLKWHDNGVKAAEVTYSYGTVTNKLEWDENGRPVTG